MKLSKSHTVVEQSVITTGKKREKSGVCLYFIYSWNQLEP